MTRPRTGLLVSLVAVALSTGCATTNRPPVSPELDPFPRPVSISHDYKLFIVKSGLTLALVPEAKTNLVSVDVRYRVGAAEDPPGKEGLAHFIEHLTFQVKSRDSEATLGDRLNESTLFNNAYTNFDETHYTSTALRESLGTLLNVEAERMTAGCEAITDERIERERQVVKREIAERSGIGTEIRTMLTEAVFAPGHPYRRSVSGTPATIDAITRADICAFIADHYGPKRAILVVSGKFDTTAVRAFVSAAFGQITKRAAAPRAPIPPTSLSGTISKHSAGIDESVLAIIVPDPTWGTAPAMDQGIFLTLLESQLDDLEDELGVQSVSTARLGGWRGGARVIFLVLEDGADATRVSDAVFATSSKLLKKLTPLDVPALKGRYRTSLIARHEPYASRAVNVADYIQYTKHNRFLLKDLEHIDGMTPARLEVEAESLELARSHIAIIVPAGAEATRKKPALADVGKSFELETWRAPVDASRAEKPIVMKAKRPQPRISRHELGNGLRVILAPDFTYPTVEIRLVFPAGTANDPRDKPGVAELAGRLLEDDTKQLTAETTRLTALANVRAYENIIKIGGRESTWVDEDTTTFSVRGMSIYTDALIWELYFRVHSGTYDKKRWERLRKLAESFDESETGDSDEPVRAALFGPSHPYTRSISARAILDLSRDDFERFRGRYYRAPGATLIVAGQFSASKVLRQIHRLWSPWSADAVDKTALEIPRALPAPGPTAFVANDPDRAQPHVLIGYALDQDSSTRAQRLVLRELLTQRLASIRERLGASYGMSVSLGSARGPVLITVSGEVESARAAEAFVEIRRAIAAVRAGGEAVAPDFVRARRRVLEQILADSASANSTASELEYIASRGESDDYFNRLAAEVAALTHSRLSAVLATQLAPTREAIVLRGAKKVTAAMLREAKIVNARAIK